MHSASETLSKNPCTAPPLPRSRQATNLNSRHRKPDPNQDGIDYLNEKRKRPGRKKSRSFSTGHRDLLFDCPTKFQIKFQGIPPKPP